MLTRSRLVVAAVIVSAVASAYCFGQSRAVASRWEYRVEVLGDVNDVKIADKQLNVAPFAEPLNKFAGDGWELVTVTNLGVSSIQVAYLRRQK